MHSPEIIDNRGNRPTYGRGGWMADTADRCAARFSDTITQERGQLAMIRRTATWTCREPSCWLNMQYSCHNSTAQKSLQQLQ